MRLRTRRRSATTPRGWSVSNIIRDNNAVAHWDPMYGVRSDGSWVPRLGGTTLNPVSSNGMVYSSAIANLNGRPGWNNDGTQYLTTGAANSFAATLDSYALIVVSYSTFSTQKCIVGFSNGGYVMSHNLNTQKLHIEDYDGTYTSAQATDARSALSVDTWWFDKAANTIEFYGNNALFGTGSGLTGNVTSDRIVLGARDVGLIELNMTGSIGDVVILQGNNYPNISNVTNALMLKYGI